MALAHKRMMLIFLVSPSLAPCEIQLLIPFTSPSRAVLANTVSNCAVLTINWPNADLAILTAWACGAAEAPAAPASSALIDSRARTGARTNASVL